MRWTLLTLALATLLPAAAAANPAIQIVHRTEQDQPSYVRLNGVPLPGLGVVNKQDQQQISGRLLQRYAAPIFHLDQQAELALGNATVQTLRDGAVRYSWQQRFAGMPVFNGRLTALVDTQQSVRVLSGQLAMQAPSALHQNNLATAARLLPLAAASIEASVPGNWNWQQKSRAELRWQRAANSAATLTAIRAMPVYVLQQNSAVPAWSFELEKTSGRRSSLWRLVLDEAGNILRKQSLSRDAAFSYKVYASNSGDLRPLDSPYGDLTPLPAGELNPVYVTANTVSVDELASTHSNSWLPNGASTLIGNHAEVYLDISGNDGFDASDRRAPQSAAGQFHWTFNGANDVRSSSENQNAAMVQAFYVANWLHDFFFDAGFVTADGTAEAGDRMLIELQDAEDTNNANMSVPGNGLSPRMQVFLFDGPSSHSAQVSGALTASYATSRAAFGPSSFNVTGQLVLMQDGTGLSVTDGCETLTNASQLAGKIALVDRGNCNFVDKANRAQQAGAIGLLVANNTSGTLTMGSPDGSPVISIGALLINQVDGNAVKAAVQSATVNANLIRTTATPIDGALDSALVAHEWGHYINNRLMDIGNVNQANGMDEGWSDFIALFALSASSDDDGGSRILGSFGFSGYAVNDFGNGLRRFPYSSDLTVNGLSFRHISNGVVLPNGQAGASNSEVHNTGEIWASALWDAYVNLVRSRGYSEAQLRMREYLVQGMKNTPSQPDFVEARDAQLDAVAALQPLESPDDLSLFQQAFAGRGLGLNADAPSKADDSQAGAIESFVWTATAVPVVNAGPDQSVVQAATVLLNGSATDADGSITAYQWQQLSGPDVTLNNGDSASASFTAPSACPSTPLVFELTATDNLQERASDQVTVTVTPAANASPTANAGTDRTVAEGAMVTLTGSGADTDGSIVSFRWSQISGRAGSFANAAAASTSFTAPMVSGTSNVVLQLTVTDNMCATATDTVTVTVQNTASSGGGGGGGGTAPALLAGVLCLLACWRKRK